MARRDSNPLYVLSLLPWRVSLIAAVSVFVLMRFVAPIFGAADNMLLHGLLNQTLPRLAPFFFCLFLLPGVLSLIRERSRSRLLDKQTGLDSVRKLDWRQFEQLTAAALAREGYEIIDSPSGADGGVDLVVLKEGKCYFVQCKQWRSQKIGVAKIRELFGVVAANKANGGIFVASGAYTGEAREFAAKSAVRLIDGEQIAQWLARVDVPSTDKSGSVNAEPEQPDCPKCSSPMVLRQAKRGANTGRSFWGCSSFPDCRGTRAA